MDGRYENLGVHLDHLPERWQSFAEALIDKGRRTNPELAGWRVDHLEHLLNKTDLDRVDPATLSPVGLSTLRWLCGWDADVLIGVSEIINAIVKEVPEFP